MIGRPIATWTACTRCAHAHNGGADCAHPTPRIIHGAPVPVDLMRGDQAYCGRDAQWHVYCAPASRAA